MSGKRVQEKAVQPEGVEQTSGEKIRVTIRIIRANKS